VHVVVLGIAGFQTTQHQAGRVIVRLVHFHHLEATLQGSIAFEVLFVFGPGGGGDGAQFATRQRRFQQVGRICAPA
jgi:hypothetical protein